VAGRLSVDYGARSLLMRGDLPFRRHRERDNVVRRPVLNTFRVRTVIYRTDDAETLKPP